MSKNRQLGLIALAGFLLLANIIYYFISNWGLITVQVKDKPLRLVIQSIERQGWVKIVTNIDPNTPVSMYVDHVPLTEAMETLSANVEGNWKLGYFTGPTSARVNEAISIFVSQGELGADWKIFSYRTPLQMLGSGTGEDDASPVGNPYLQAWSGVLPPPTTPAGFAPPPPPPAPSPTGFGTVSPAPDAAATPAPPDDTGTILASLREMARATDIWIMAPADWRTLVKGPPAPSSSIRSAVRSLVSSAHGVVKEVLVLQARRRGFGGGGGGRGFGGDLDDATFARLQNEISTLPPEQQEGLTQRLNQEKTFKTSLQSVPPEQRGPLIQQHFIQEGGADRFANANARQSPEKRAARYRAMVQAKQAAMGKTAPHP